MLICCLSFLITKLSFFSGFYLKSNNFWNIINVFVTVTFSDSMLKKNLWKDNFLNRDCSYYTEWLACFLTAFWLVMLCGISLWSMCWLGNSWALFPTSWSSITPWPTPHNPCSTCCWLSAPSLPLTGESPNLTMAIHLDQQKYSYTVITSVCSFQSPWD